MKTNQELIDDGINFFAFLYHDLLIMHRIDESGKCWTSGDDDEEWEDDRSFVELYNTYFPFDHDEPHYLVDVGWS